MLIVYSQFLIKQAVRSSLYLLNPTIVNQEEINYPRLSVFHYLDTSNNNHFPTRDLIYFKAIANNKRVYISNVSDLKYQEGIATIANRTLTIEYRKWLQANIKSFKLQDLKLTPNVDTYTAAVVNYNGLVNLYKYKSTMLTNYYRYTNLYSTYWDSVHEYVENDKVSNAHFVSIELPNTLPSYNILNMMLTFKKEKFARLVTDTTTLRIIDLYRWLANSYRSSSTMRSITDEDSLKIVLELTYRGYSVFIPLHIFRSMCEDSTLENKIKVPLIKLQKIFIHVIKKIQTNVISAIEQIEADNADTTSEASSDTETKDTETKSVTRAVTTTVSVADDEEIVKDDLADSVLEPKSVSIKKTNDKTIQTLKDTDIDIPNVNELFNTSLDEFKDDDEQIDAIYKRSINSINEDSSEEEEQVHVYEPNYTTEHVNSILKDSTIDTKIDKHIEDAITFKTMTTSEIRSLKKLKEKRTTLKSPYDDKVNIDLFKDISSNDLELLKRDTSIDVDNIFIDDNYKVDSCGKYDSKYLKVAYKKHVVASITSLEKSGIIVKNYEVQKKQDSLGVHEEHILNIKPLVGKESTVHFRLPVIDDEGEYISGGNKRRVRKQRMDMPIRKISDSRVSITSNYGKTFIFRSERVVDDPALYVNNYIRKSYLSHEGIVKSIIPGKKVLIDTDMPNIYYCLAKDFNKLVIGDIVILLNEEHQKGHIEDKLRLDLRKNKLWFCGYIEKSNDILVVAMDNIFYNYTKDEPVGTIEDILGIDNDKVPKAHSVIKIMGDNIPLGVVISFYLGLKNLLAITKSSFTLVESNKHFKANRSDVVLRFSDYRLVVTNATIATRLLLQGFLFYKDYIKGYNLKDFDVADVYLGMLEFRGAAIMHLKEMSLMKDLFLDPITIELLKGMNEPTEYIPLLLRANEMLSNYNYPAINDPKYSTIKGYNRIPGLMYREIAKSVREQRINGRSNSKIELDPYGVWNAIEANSAITEDNNPITDLKEMELVTLSGTDGLSKDATPLGIRRFHASDKGLISEGTVDSADVALNIYMTPGAKIKDINGSVDIESTEADSDPAKAYSTSALLAPFVEYDNMPRINFVQIQNAHTISSEGNAQSGLRTGYEYVVPFRVGKLYAFMAKEGGVVLDLTDKTIRVKYKSGEEDSAKLGVIYGRMEGSVYPHTVVTDLKKGSRFKVNDPICYNSSFFERDWLNPNQLVMKLAKCITVALTNNNEVYEDSCAISRKLGNDMATTVIKEKIYVIDFTKHIVNRLKEGSEVTPDTILFTIAQTEGEYGNLTQSAVDMLENLSNLSPKAKYNGILDRYEIKYHGELSDMSSSLRKLASELDLKLLHESKGTAYEASNNKVSREYRSEGKNLNPNTLELKVFIKVRLLSRSGDKGVFANQMKSVISDVMTSTVTTQSGKEVDAMFSFKGILNRIVSSPILIGTTLRLLNHRSKQIADMYFK